MGVGGGGEGGKSRTRCTLNYGNRRDFFHGVKTVQAVSARS